MDDDSGIRMLQDNTLWRGRFPLDWIDWKLDSGKEFTLSPELESKRNEIWQNIISEYPETYDGRLLVLDEFNIDSQNIFLNMGFITFSRILTLEKYNLGFHQYGCIGAQALILSPDKTHILFGQRSEGMMYCPLYYGGPGGMSEIADAELPFQTAILREIEEEVNLNFQTEKYLLAIMKDLYTKVGVCFLVECIVPEPFDLNTPVVGNEEWIDNQLQWYPIEDLESLEPSQCLESPIFAIYELNQFKAKGQSVLWS
jgi:8-oxo-dGTP pyrophosphatase MutT (NUDIX family)